MCIARVAEGEVMLLGASVTVELSWNGHTVVCAWGVGDKMRGMRDGFRRGVAWYEWNLDLCAGRGQLCGAACLWVGLLLAHLLG